MRIPQTATEIWSCIEAGLVLDGETEEGSLVFVGTKQQWDRAHHLIDVIEIEPYRTIKECKEDGLLSLSL